MAAPALDPRLAALFGRVWRTLPHAAARAGELGFAWTAISTPFVRWQGAQAIAHVGVIKLPLVVDGRRVRVASIHAVCTDPAERGRGHCRALMEEALAYCDARYETVVLTTLIPDLYAKFGFRPLQEHGFVRPLPSAAREPRVADSPRMLSGDAPDDVELLRRLLARRAPVSTRLGSLEDGTVLVVALLLTWGDFSRVHHHPALDVVTVHEVRDRTLLLYDVVAPVLPPLERLTEGIDADRVIVLFPPERLGDGFAPEPWDAARARSLSVDDTILMARGPFVETGPFMLQPLSRT